MKVIHSIKELKEYVHQCKRDGKSIGLVTTMGALHEGHASLIQAARKENDVVITTVFVNPTQFGPNEDYEAIQERWMRMRRSQRPPERIFSSHRLRLKCIRTRI